MLAKQLLVAAIFGIFAQAANAVHIRTDAQCQAIGKKLRQSGHEKHRSASLLNIKITENDQGASLDYLGQIAAGYEWEETPAGKTKLFGYVGVFSGEEKANTLSPSARRYTDDKYYRFAGFDSTDSTLSEGGGMWGYLVVSKRYFDRSAETFTAHYVFQSGDHMGGTIDFTCVRR